MAKKQIDISEDAKSKLKNIYKEVIVDELAEQLRKQHKDAMMLVEESLKSGGGTSESEKKHNKTILAKLEEIIIRIDMLESKEENGLEVFATNSKILMIANILLVIGLAGVILMKM